MAHRVSNKTASTAGNKQGRVCRNGNSIYATDGMIWTGHYEEWATMKDVDKEKVTAERERKKKNRTGKGSKGKTYKRKVSDLSSLTEDIQAMKRSVAELISKEKGLGPIVIDRRHSGHEKVCRRDYLQEGQNGR